jgi:hypothetical protein
MSHVQRVPRRAVSLMTKYQVPAIDLTEEELSQELERPFSRP